VRASEWIPVIVLIALDLPALERPANPTSAIIFSGSCSLFCTASKKPARR